MVAAGFGSYNLLIYLLDEAPEGRSGTLEDSLEMPMEQGGQRNALDASASANSSMDARVLTQRELEFWSWWPRAGKLPALPRTGHEQALRPQPYSQPATQTERDYQVGSRSHWDTDRATSCHAALDRE